MNKCVKCGNQVKIISEYKFHNIFECQSCSYQKVARINNCCRKPFKIVVIEQYNFSLFRLYHQCKNCGGVLDRTRPLSFKEYEDEIRYNFKKESHEEWKNNIKEEMSYISKEVSENNYRNSKKGQYDIYLYSKEWKLKRDLVLKRDKYICQECKVNQAIDVHHLNYDRLFNEKLEDLLSLCRECHFKIHNQNSQEQNNK